MWENIPYNMHSANVDPGPPWARIPNGHFRTLPAIFTTESNLLKVVEFGRVNCRKQGIIQHHKQNGTLDPDETVR